jgi:hypothetical protein
MQPDPAKLKELILHVAQRSEGDRTFGKVKLNKILFYADFAAYARRGVAITGQEYARYPHGPVAPAVQPALDEMVRDGVAAVVDRRSGAHVQQRIFALRDPDLSLFTAEEIALVDEVISDLWGKPARDVSDLSHEFVGWQVARVGEVVPYETALIDTSPWTEEEEAHGDRLAASGRV